MKKQATTSTYTTLRTELAARLAKLHVAAAELAELYDQHPHCNDIQPAGFEHIIPCSLDEWVAEIGYVRQQLADDITNA